MKSDAKFYYNGFGNTFFLNYLYNDFLTNTPVAGQSGFFYGQDNYLNNNSKILETDTTIKYEINSHGFRCDEFTDPSNNFLFAGCSETFGLGLPNEYRWSYLFNKTTGSNYFYDLSVPASSIYMIVNNVVNYLKNIGKPKGIFIMFPDLFRMPNFILYRENSYLLTNFVKPELIDQNSLYSLTPKHISINSINVLEFICELMDIDLLWSTWDIDFNKEILENNLHVDIFKNYINVLDNVNYKDIDKNDFELYGDIARDRVHFGAHTHFMFSKVFEKEYKALINEK